MDGSSAEIETRLRGSMPASSSNSASDSSLASATLNLAPVLGPVEGFLLRKYLRTRVCNPALTLIK